MKRRTLTPRGRALRWLTRHRGLTEQPLGSNRDTRKDGITAAQRQLGAWLIGQPWCGVWAAMAALAGGVRITTPWRWASVAYIEDDARERRNGFRGWAPPSVDSLTRRVLRGDLAVLFGRGVHVAVVREIHPPRRWRPYWLVITDEGNTSSEGANGSQSNGHRSARRRRALADVHGFALVDFPG